MKIKRGKAPTIEISPVAVKLLGPPGRLLSASKSDYLDRFPTHEVWFNACIFDANGVQTWFGDLDLDAHQTKLQELGELIGPIWVTCERPYRFDGLPSAPEVRDDIRRYGTGDAGQAVP